METVEKLVKAPIIADLHDMSVYSVYRTAQAGEIPCYRRKRSVRFSLREVREAMRSTAIAASGAGPSLQQLRTIKKPRTGEHQPGQKKERTG